MCAAVRRYDATRRRVQARENRSRILDAAGRLFLEHGYAETTMPEVARVAGVSVQTVYKGFTNKVTLLKAVFDASVTGDDDPTPMAEREAIAAIRAEPDAARKITNYARLLAEGADRHGPVQLVARDAAGADPAAAEVWARMRAEVLTAMTHFAGDLIATGQVRAGLTADDARDVLWVLHSPELYDLLVRQRGWSTERYGEFVAEAMINAVLSG